MSSIQGRIKKSACCICGCLLLTLLFPLQAAADTTRLLDAARKGDGKTVQAIIDGGADVNAVNQAGDTALMYAAKNNHPHVAELLLKAGADPDLRNRYGVSALTLAVNRGYTYIARLLLEKGLDLREYGGVLINAVINDKSSTLKLLLEHGIDVNYKDKRTGMTGLHYASLKTAPLLLGHGARIDGRDDSGYTPLMMAAYDGRTGVVKLLLKKGAKPDLTDYKYGETALMIAVKERQKEAVRLLAQASDLALKSLQGDTALSIAEQEGYQELTDILKEAARVDKGK